MTRSTAVALARLSCLMPIIAVLIYLIFVTGITPGGAHDDVAIEGQLCATGGFLGLGVVFAFMAMKAIRRRGPKKIRIPAAIGMVTNGVLVIVLVVQWAGKLAEG